ncbi:MAG TPA: hypothetical protein P5150_09455, partial [Candidatus Ratteibacteria bacterium]|nr:hypothetical protein [Candidatus Ratteibacteria bacterium]
PILSIGYKESVIKQLLKETSVGVHCSCVNEIKQILFEWYHEWENNGFVSFEGREDKINNYTHKKMAEKFAEILENK